MFGDSDSAGGDKNLKDFHNVEVSLSDLDKSGPADKDYNTLAD